MIPQYRVLLDRCKNIIDAAGDSNNDEFIRTQIAALVCVLLAGVLESILRELLTNFSKKKSHPSVARFVEINLESYTNATPDKILTLLGRFDSSWVQDTEIFWENEIKDHIGSIVGNRHLIAHGRSTSLTLTRVNDWRKSAVKFSYCLENKLLIN